MKFLITHAWESEDGKFCIMLDGVGMVYTTNKEAYNKAIKEGYLELELEEPPSTETVL